uniref:Protein kinase domain-containing protein n=1 Tax=Fagus sylvatica TaxID=28930 RepID=A0A2N9GXI8_FAGSY
MSPVNFQVNELESFTNSFQASNLLRPGGFRNVYRGFIPANNSHGLEEMNVAVKRSHGLRKREEYVTEVRWLTEVQHPNVVKLIGHCEGPANFYLVYELIEGGTVNDKLLGKYKHSFMLSSHSLQMLLSLHYDLCLVCF